MQLSMIPIVKIILLMISQLLVAGGLASFGVLSRMHEDKAFPRETRGRRLLSHMHRERLHLIMILVFIEAFIVVLTTVTLPGIVGDILSGGWSVMQIPVFIPVTVCILLFICCIVAGGGIAIIRPVSMALVVSVAAFPFYIVLRPLSGFFLRTVSLVFPELPREMASPLFIFPGSGEGGEGFIEKNGSMLVHSIVEFGEKKVREVMVPRIDVFALDIHSSIEEIRESVAEAGHSRVPIFDSSIDRITGILCVKDLVHISRDEQNVDINRLLRETYFVPEGKKIDELLREFQLEKKHMAVVVDEYGGTSGIVTLEDILEEIVGEIRDEHDQEEPLVRKTAENEYSVEGRINLDDLGESLNVSLPSDRVDTLGGFLYDLIGRVPDEGDEVTYAGIEFKIDRLDGQRISQVLIRLPYRDDGD